MSQERMLVALRYIFLHEAVHFLRLALNSESA